ncbi:hypothetical protein [Sandaracinus amylolyticus]|uniref:Lipoprotein n=1 Tax=Sandaracinus amylolyticus TaxID=927083 RepID=A0A0F6YH90_9BACT|nr:hypothetical protein [Sandaracinus amylolyticus]AKF03738.1 hypothetical protein DB32_000887 [Sandaracinus amylolyticus]
MDDEVCSLTRSRIALLWLALVSACSGAHDGSPAAPHVIAPGQEATVAAMLGEGDPLPDGCTWDGAAIDHDRVIARFVCATGGVAIELRHPELGSGAARTEQFVLVPTSGTASPALLRAITARVRAREASFRWSRTQSRATAGS